MFDTQTSGRGLRTEDIGLGLARRSGTKAAGCPQGSSSHPARLAEAFGRRQVKTNQALCLCLSVANPKSNLKTREIKYVRKKIKVNLSKLSHFDPRGGRGPKIQPFSIGTHLKPLCRNGFFNSKLKIYTPKMLKFAPKNTRFFTLSSLWRKVFVSFVIFVFKKVGRWRCHRKDRQASSTVVKHGQGVL